MTSEPDQPPGAPAAAPVSGATEALQTRVDELTESTASAQRRADELAVVARKQSEMADELHAENVRLRAGELREAIAPLVRGLARLSDEIGQIRGAGAPPTEADLIHLDQRVKELLHDAGVTPLAPAPGDPFDVHVHTAAGSVPTEDPLQDHTVVAVRRPGLIRDDGRVLRPADVLVYRFDLRHSTAPADHGHAPDPDPDPDSGSADDPPEAST